MNETVKQKHLDGLTDERAKALYVKLCEACESRPEGMSESELQLVADVASLEQLKQQLFEDIRKRGVVEDFHNGRQHMKRENKSVQGVRMIMDQQRKHLAELRLTPNSRKAAQIPIDDDFDKF